ncbi:MAG: 1-(5-phosphoribosyl)-5-((5-phosphoribosylamino)methylideneamino)imidazole-4-carboxamide isomerase [Microbacteriaceae bacterium]|nr:1-(5-phosphoribosyl)-5-((5-phosphoribosylamino)methylideneamino)imidazole-4-carboxamide isomerase [Microbacteriaceae bacterium]
MLYPSIDLRGGQVVRLRQGDYEDQLTYDVTPAATADRFCADGAPWIHVVDLDAARSGVRSNAAAVAEVVAATGGRAQVQVGGGVRTVADAQALRDLGVDRVVVGSAAVADPPIVAAMGKVLPVTVGLDHRDGRIAVHGWTETSDLQVTDAVEQFPTAAAFLVTNIAHDGMLTGPDVAGLAALVPLAAAPVIASGGVGTLDDIAALARIPGLGGIITGRALYEGRFSVADAVAAIGRAASLKNEELP